jgi:hypothetical protein
MCNGVAPLVRREGRAGLGIEARGGESIGSCEDVACWKLSLELLLGYDMLQVTLQCLHRLVQTFPGPVTFLIGESGCDVKVFRAQE